MKRLIPLIAVCFLLGCRGTDIENNIGRNAVEEQVDSTNTNSNFSVPEWSDSINISY